MKTPVALILFNRPELTQRVFELIADAKPEKLFLIADGPRVTHESDFAKCAEARKVVENIDWECDVFRNFSDKNLGCGYRPASGISWVFEHVDRAIILEDDCVPHPDFFRFCGELLEKYKNDDRVMQINGHNLQLGEKRSDFSYYYSEYPITWGWATWKRAWKYFDFGLSHWKELRETGFPVEITGDEGATKYWRHNFEEAYQTDNPQDYHAWDYQWTFAFWLQHGLSISPTKNLVSNIGFGEDATHTKGKGNIYAYQPVTGCTFPLEHPPHKLVNHEADNFFIEEVSKKVRFIEKRKLTFSHKLKNKMIQTLRFIKKSSE